MPQLALLLSEHNARHLRQPMPEVSYVLLERTLHDPPRAAAATRWAAQLRLRFPQAELIPWTWHLVSHALEDGLRKHAARTLPGDPSAFGGLKDTPENALAWRAALPCMQALEPRRIALRTPVSITPGPLGRSRIGAFVEARRAELGWETLWEPDGLWELDDAAAFARQIGATLMWRGFVAGRPQQAGSTLLDEGIWIRVDGAARSARIHADQLDALLVHAEEDPGAVFAFAGAAALTNLRSVARELPTP
jgi:hypothetical protein